MSKYLLYQKRNNVSKIIPNLFLGNKFSPNKKYDLIVNCSTDLPNIINNTINIKLKDSPLENDNMYKQIYEKNVLEEIHFNLQKNKKVLIHCHMGMQRSATITACYLMKYHNIKFPDVIDFIKSKRKIAFFFSINFNDTIIKIANDINRNII